MMTATQTAPAASRFVPLKPAIDRNEIDAAAEREGQAIRRHRRLTTKHRRAVYRLAGIGDPRP